MSLMEDLRCPLNKVRVQSSLALFVQFRPYPRPGVCDRLLMKRLVTSNAKAGKQFKN